METAWLLPDLDDPTSRRVLGGCARGRAARAGVRVVRPAAHAAPADVPALPVDRSALGADVGARPDLVVHRPASAAAARVRGGRAVQRDHRRARRGSADPLRRATSWRAPTARSTRSTRHDRDRRAGARRVPPDRRRDAPPLGPASESLYGRASHISFVFRDFRGSGNGPAADLPTSTPLLATPPRNAPLRGAFAPVSAAVLVQAQLGSSPCALRSRLQPLRVAAVS